LEFLKWKEKNEGKLISNPDIAIIKSDKGVIGSDTTLSVPKPLPAKKPPVNNPEESPSPK